MPRSKTSSPTLIKAPIKLRGIAFIIDFFIFVLINTTLSFLTAAAPGTSLLNDVVEFVSIILFTFYLIWTAKNWQGQSIGKKLVSIRVASTAVRLTFSQITTRFVVREFFLRLIPLSIAFFFKGSSYGGMWIIILLLFIIPVLFTKTGQSIHDLFANTWVVKAR